MGLGYSSAPADEFHFAQAELLHQGTLCDLYHARSTANPEEKAVIFSFSKAKGAEQLKIAQNAVAVRNSAGWFDWVTFDVGFCKEIEGYETLRHYEVLGSQRHSNRNSNCS